MESKMPSWGLKGWILGLILIAYYVLIFYVLADFGFINVFVKLFEYYYDRPADELSSVAINLLNAIINFSVYILIFIPFVLTMMVEFESSLYKIKDENKESNKVVKFFFIMLGVFFIVNFVSSILSNLIYEEESTNQTEITKILKSDIASFLLMSIPTVILAPVVEELVFRYSFFSIIKNKWAALIISSLVFGSIHIITSDVKLIYRLALLFPYFASGVVFGITYEKSNRNIWLPIFLHMSTNLISLVLIMMY